MKTKFTIRDLFWLTLICALGIGWWTAYRQRSAMEVILDEERSEMLSLRKSLRESGFGTALNPNNYEQLVITSGGINGAIKVDGKPLPAGSITFTQPSGWFIGTAIKDGEYRLEYIPNGKYSVSFQGDGVPDSATTSERTPHAITLVDVDYTEYHIDFNLGK